mgnify:CR=1 FL=1
MVRLCGDELVSIKTERGFWQISNPVKKIKVDLTIIVGFNILAVTLRVAANFIFELSICVVMSGCMCACVDSIFSKPCGS